MTGSVRLTGAQEGTADSVTGVTRQGNALQWQIPSPSGVPMMMLPGMANYQPGITPFLPGRDLDPDTLTAARPRDIVPLAEGDTLDLEAMFVRRIIGGRTFVMYGFNGQYPGPLIRVRAQTTVVIRFINHIDLPATVHWHGVRLDNRFDGVPGVTQEPVQPGETFLYRVHFPDAGIYWYHPHHREDVQQELGLYGNMLVDSPDSAFYNPVNREETLMLDDLLLRNDGIAPFGKEAANHALMGRFGNVFLVNGETDYRLQVQRGEVVRFYVTNVSNTRIYNLVFDGAPIKVVGGDIGKFEHERWVPGVVIAPAERYVVEVRFDRSGTFALTNRVQTIDHFRGEFRAMIDTLGQVIANDEPATPDYSPAFEELRTNAEVVADIEHYRDQFTRPPDHELLLTIRVSDLPSGMIQFMSIDTAYYPPVEWTDVMPMMNWVSNATNTHWLLRDVATGAENMDIDWRIPQGDVFKLRLRNDANAFHPMSHPIHLHGQRFLVLERDGVPNDNFVWKETVLIPVGTTVDLLVDASNPGAWMLHCHIAEHLEAGMGMVFRVGQD